MKINTKKIGLFLKSLNGAEYHYMNHCMGIRDALNDLIKRHKLTKEDVCKKFNIKSCKYNDFVKGAHNYDMREMATLNAWFMELEMEALKKKVPIKVIKERE